MALGMVVAQDLANALLPHHMRGAVLSQTTTDKPLLRLLREKQKEFPAGNKSITDPVQGTYMSDSAGFLVGYSEDDALTFNQAQNILRTSYNWFELHCGLEITWTELKKDGITISDNNKSTEHSDREIDILTDVLENRLADFSESLARTLNATMWADGTQDAKAWPGVKSILTDTPAQGTTGGLNRATYPWWQHRVILGIVPSQADQTLTRTLRSELRQLKVYGGKPNVALVGSAFMNALEEEYQSKGLYTQEGFSKGKNDMGMDEISLKGLGTFQFDPTMDQMGASKRCVIYDNRRLVFRPMQGESNKMLQPERPYQYAVLFRSVTNTGCLVCTQLNGCAVYSIA